VTAWSPEGYYDPIRQATADATRRLQQQREQELAALLFVDPAGTTLCVHEPEFVTPDFDPKVDTYRMQIRQPMHKLAPGEACAGRGLREQYTVPVRERP